MTTTSTTTKTSGRIVAAVVAGGVALAGITAAVTMSLVAPSAAAHTTAGGSSSQSATTGGHSHSHHDVLPSASIKHLQGELAQLNYYDGPVSGYWNQGTTNAIEYLQRAADLPQTGTMNSATQQALAYQLAHGDNQMGG